MLAYPQLTTGALTQYPLQKRRRLRTIMNALADGSAIKLADAAGETTEWQLQYTGLSDDEASVLQQFFEATEGNLNTCTFLDPTGNLFAWSDQLDDAAWSKAPFLSLAAGVTDAVGGTSGWHIQNSGAGAQTLTQTLAAPGGYLYCLSGYVKSSQGAQSVTLLLGTERGDQAVGADWSRITLTGRGDASAESMVFGIEAAAGVSLDVFGLQVEPQAAAAVYKQSTTGGVYPHTAFRDATLSLTATDVNRHSATVNLIHAIG